MFFIVTMTHPDGPAWGRYIQAHVAYLEEMVRAGSLKASGPLKDGPLRAGFLIFHAKDRPAVERLVADDPFAKHNVIHTLTIREWDPVFGAFSQDSSRRIPGSSEVKGRPEPRRVRRAFADTARLPSDIRS